MVKSILSLRAAACDLDGTILDGSDISVENANAVELLTQLGVTVVLASGRNYHHMTRYYRQLGLTSPVVSSDGALVSIPNGEIICERTMSQEASRSIMAEAERLKVSCLCFFKHGIHTSTVGDWNEAMERHREIGRHFKHSTSQALAKRRLYKALLYSRDPARLDAMQAHAERNFRQDVDAIRNGPNTLEFVAKGVSKVSALEAVAEFLHLKAENFVAFGDGKNDVGMLGWAQTSVCMHHGNPAAQTAATQVAPETDAAVNFAAAVAVIFQQPEVLHE